MGATSAVRLLGGQGDVALRTHERRANVVGQARQIALELALLGGALALALVGGIQRAVHRAGQIGETRSGHFGGQAAVGTPVAIPQEAGHTTKLVAVQQHHREPAERQASEANGKRHNCPFSFRLLQSTCRMALVVARGDRGRPLRRLACSETLSRHSTRCLLQIALAQRAERQRGAEGDCDTAHDEYLHGEGRHGQRSSSRRREQRRGMIAHILHARRERPRL